MEVTDPMVDAAATAVPAVVRVSLMAAMAATGTRSTFLLFAFDAILTVIYVLVLRLTVVAEQMAETLVWVATEAMVRMAAAL
jgi:hypothetical protein